MAGDSPQSAIEAVRRLNAVGLTATIDVLGEDVTDRDGARRVRESYLDLIDRIAVAGVETNLSIEVSTLGLTFDPDEAHHSFEHILDYARAMLADPFVRIDMDGHRLLEPTLAFFESTWTGHRNTGPALQAHLHRTPSDVARMIEVGAPVLLCEGAYHAASAIAVRGHAAVRSRFLACATPLLRDGVYPAVATRDPVLIAAVRELAPRLGRATDEYEFQLPYGVRPDLQRELVAAGHRVRVRVPFGTRWARYFLRSFASRR